MKPFDLLDMWKWLFCKGKKGKCPRCNYPITEKSTKCTLEKYTDEIYDVCPNCIQEIDWENFK